MLLNGRIDPVLLLGSRLGHEVGHDRRLKVKQPLRGVGAQDLLDHRPHVNRVGGVVLCCHGRPAERVERMLTKTCCDCVGIGTESHDFRLVRPSGIGHVAPRCLGGVIEPELPEELNDRQHIGQTGVAEADVVDAASHLSRIGGCQSNVGIKVVVGECGGGIGEDQRHHRIDEFRRHRQPGDLLIGPPAEERGIFQRGQEADVVPREADERKAKI